MHRNPTRLACFMLALLLLVGSQHTHAQVLPDPDGQPADMSQPVQVYILMGQSNMLGFGKPDVLQGIAADKYPYLVDDAGAWTVRKDVRNVFIMASGNKIGAVKKNEWLTVSGRFGPEIGIGHHLGEVTDAPVLILKSCIGNRSLGWDLLPPGSEPYEHGGKMQPGYRGTPDNPGGDTGGDMSKGWYAGCQYDGDVSSAKHILENLDKYYPGATEYEVKGFFWWQGDKDMRNAAHAERYGLNLVNLIQALRKDFDAPNALFVTASLGQTKMGSTGGDGKILDAMKAVAQSDHEDLKGKVGFVYTHPLSKGGSSSGHYGGNPETYMNVGEAMGKAMVELLKNQGDGDAKAGNDQNAEPAALGEQPMRTWTSKGGSTMQAKLVGIEGGRVVLELENGSKRKYSKSAFSEEDRAYIEKFGG
ncbi:MAG: sialate O-acetylesterase [Phycisphaeraceae bacterium]